MLKIYLAITLITSVNATLSGQGNDLTPGFDMLQNQEYQKAADFFADQIKNNPGDKTSLICYGRAMGLGINPAKGLSHFESLSDMYPGDFEVGLNLAEALMWNSDFPNARKKYKELLDQDPHNFVANYGFANANAALKNYDKAIHFINEAIKIDPENASAKNARMHIYLGCAYDYFLDRDFDATKQWVDTVFYHYPGNPQAYDILAQLKGQRQSELTIGYTDSQDQAGNLANEKTVSGKFQISDKQIIKLGINLRQASTNNFETSSKQNVFQLMHNIFLNKKLSVEWGAGVNEVFGENISGTITPLYFGKAILKPWSRQHIELGYINEMHNYNPALLRSKIKIEHYSLTYHTSLPITLGLFANAMHTRQSDGNTRNLLFASLYYDFGKSPLKAGINYSTMSYSFSNPELYFSPKHFNSQELFALVEGRITKYNLEYFALAGYGRQNIELTGYQSQRRFEVKFNYKLVQDVYLGISYLNSNTAANSAIGLYEFSRWHINLKAIL